MHMRSSLVVVVMGGKRLQTENVGKKINENSTTNKRRSFLLDPLIRIKPHCICALYSDKKVSQDDESFGWLGGAWGG